MLRELRSKAASIGVCWVTQAAKVQFLKFLSSETKHELSNIVLKSSAHIEQFPQFAAHAYSTLLPFQAGYLLNS